MHFDRTVGIEHELSQSAAEKVVKHRNYFYHMIRARYRELLPSLIRYNFIDDTRIKINFLELEEALRSGYLVAVGETALGTLQVLGVVKETGENSKPFTKRRLTDDDILFSLPIRYRLPHYREILENESAELGNFVLIKNKQTQYISDFEIVDHYAESLAEIEASRYSLAMQAKINTILRGEEGDESINQLISALYNGAPYIKSSRYFDPESDILKLDNGTIASNFSELKREYQNKLTELNSILGISALGVDKESGVTQIEALSGDSFTNVNANIYLEPRNRALKLLNRNFGTSIEAEYNDLVNSEMKRGGEFSENDNNSNT